jgi:hypothetical protein
MIPVHNAPKAKSRPLSATFDSHYDDEMTANSNFRSETKQTVVSLFGKVKTFVAIEFNLNARK